jgi:hypothetical protein
LFIAGYNELFLRIGCSGLAKSGRKVFLYGMSAVMPKSKTPEIHVFKAPDLQILRAEVGTVRGLKVIAENRATHAQVRGRDLSKPQMRQWFEMIPEIQAQARNSIARQLEEWFAWIDGILDIHRRSYVFREPTPAQLSEHKVGLELAIEYCRLISILIDVPEFTDPDLAARLEIRLRQLRDAYGTFHDDTLSDAQAEEVLKQVFPA